jgi:hypothetical protein
MRSTPVLPSRSAVPVAAWTVAASILLCAGAAHAQSAPAAAAVTYMAQNWSAADRETFYTTGQGSHLIPAAWFKALRRLDVDQPFAADQLARYGYLGNDSPNNRDGLPIGFVVETRTGQLGMTCAACHTGQVEYTKDGVNHVLRIDGAPASADFQQFLLDLTAVARATLNQSDRFDTFAKAVLGNGYSAASAAQLKSQFGDWVKQFGAFMDASLPASPWGPARLDAFGMIFNRVAGRDLGIVGNFKIADGPVSYPFLWNAPRQDHTQWNGGVPNGLFLQALGRNTGEVFGVFADFTPTALAPGVISYKNNSADFAGLETLEEKIAVLQPPQWPSELFGFQEPLAQKGGVLFDQFCGGCHAEKTSPLLKSAWLTPVKAVGSDPKMYDNAARQSDPGIYSGVFLPPPAFGVFVNPADTKDILAGSVVGALLDEAFPITPIKLLQSGVWRAIRKDLAGLSSDQINGLVNVKSGIVADLRSKIEARLGGMFTKPAGADAGAAYESRVLHGIWATAPYLHNGSVPNLWELMKPAKDRVKTFNVGCRHFDVKNVGFVIDDPSCKTGTFVVDPNNANGNGNGGHEYGTSLTEDQRWAIVEYLKKY